MKPNDFSVWNRFEKTGFAYSDDIIMPALEQAANAAKSISRQGGHHAAMQAYKKTSGHQLYLPVNPLNSLNENDKITFNEQF